MRKTIFIFLVLFLAISSTTLADTFKVTSEADSGAGSLRAAINLANANPGADTISFDWSVLSLTPGNFVLLEPTTPLPSINDQLTINALSGEGTPYIELSGSALFPGENLLTISGNSNEVKGLAITNVSGAGIVIDGGKDNRINSCYFGLNPTGTSVGGNKNGLMLMGGAINNIVGSSSASAMNVIGVSSNAGIYITGPTTASNYVIGNYIGLEADGSTPSENKYGIVITDEANNQMIGAGNTITNCYTAGVLVGKSAIENTITQNSFYNNGLGISLVDNGNGETQAPQISSAQYNPLSGKVEIAGLVYPEGENGQVEVFFADNNEGRTYIDSISTSDVPEWSGSLSLPTAGDNLVVTATGLGGTTSPFSEQVTVASKELSFILEMPAVANSAEAFTLTISVSSETGEPQTDLTVSGSVELSVDSGLISPAYIAGSAFVNGEWSGSVTVYGLGNKTITGSLNSVTGSKSLILYNAESTQSDVGGVSNLDLVIAEGAVSQEVTITASAISSPGDAPEGYTLVSSVYSITVVGQSSFDFREPIQITMPLTSTAKDGRVYYWTGSAWSRSGINTVSQTDTSITFTTDHLTTFAAFGASSNNLVRFGPNPYSGSGNAKIWYWLDSNAATSIYIVDLSGNLVRKIDYASGVNGGQAGVNNVTYNGKDAWGKTLANGVYLFKVVQGGKSVGGGKFAVIK